MEEGLEDKLSQTKYLIPVLGYVELIRDRLNEKHKGRDLKDYQDIQFTPLLMGAYQIFVLSAIGYLAYYSADKLLN